MLWGRETERARIDRLLDDARSGRSTALVIRGDAGIGKSALVEYAAAAAAGMRVLRGVGIESEAELAFGALYALLYPYLDRLDALPPPQADALRAAFGLIDASDTSRFLIGAGTLSLLTELAAEGPVLCLIDDAQWLDQGSSDALLFAARRFHADAIAVLCAVRDTAVPFPTPGVEVLRVDALPRTVAGQLLDERAPGLTVPGRERVLDESAGNPLALMELGVARRNAERAGQADPAHYIGPLPLTRRVQDTFVGQIATLPERTRLILLVAAADSGAGLHAIVRVAHRFGAGEPDLAPAEAADLVVVSTDSLRFRHPLIRAAAYQHAAHHHRVTVHRAFAEVLSDPADADRRAWHLAAATSGPDDAVAAELERSAQRAQHRGGAMAVSTAYDRAGRLSTDPEQKARRILAAARAAYDAGKPDRATRLAAEAAALTSDNGIAADATHIRAQVEYERTSPAQDAIVAMAAADLVPDDPARAVFILTEVICAARDAARYDLLRDGVARMRKLTLPPELAVHAQAQIAWADFLDGRRAAAGPLLAAQIAATDAHADYLHLVVAAFCGVMIADDAGTIAAMDTAVARARATGALLWIPYSLEFAALAQALDGRFVEARATVAEGVSLARELGLDIEAVVIEAVEVWLAAASGDDARCAELGGRVLEFLAARHPTNAACARWGLGVFALAAGRCDAALAELEAVCAGPARNDFLIRAIPDHVEAATRAGDPERARTFAGALDDWAAAVKTPVARALSLRCRGLLDDAEAPYRSALELSTGRYDAARTRLLLGEWLRRHRRRTEARAVLLEALRGFEQIGAAGWAQRTRVELAALGDEPVGAVADPLKTLTPQEIQVVRLAAAGMSNKEIAAQLFLSPRTIGHHLYKAYPKLGISKRIELARFATGSGK